MIGIEELPLVQPGDDSGELVANSMAKSGISLKDGDILATSQKIASKAEADFHLDQVTPSKRTEELAKLTQKDPRLLEHVLKELRRVLGIAERALVVETHAGLVCINAGIDKPNVAGKDNYSLLPKDLDESAQQITSKLRELTGKSVDVIICDTYRRPLRNGIAEFAR